MEKQGLEEFRAEILKKRESSVMKITNSWGINDAYKSIRKQKWFDIGRPLKTHEFYTIVRSINKLLAEEIAKGNDVSFPSRMGKLELRKTPRGAKFKNGKLKITYSPDWDKTLKLWYEDEEARREKIIIRDESKFFYRVKYNKYNATFENKGFYQFALNRFIKKALKENIKSGKIDTLW